MAPVINYGRGRLCGPRFWSRCLENCASRRGAVHVFSKTSTAPLQNTYFLSHPISFFESGKRPPRYCRGVCCPAVCSCLRAWLFVRFLLARSFAFARCSFALSSLVSQANYCLASRKVRRSYLHDLPRGFARLVQSPGGELPDFCGHSWATVRGNRARSWGTSPKFWMGISENSSDQSWATAFGKPCRPPAGSPRLYEILTFWAAPQDFLRGSRGERVGYGQKTFLAEAPWNLGSSWGQSWTTASGNSFWGGRARALPGSRAAGLPGCPAARLPGRILVSSRGRSWVIALGVLAEIVKSVWGGLSQLWGTIFSDCFGDSCKAPGGSGPIPLAIAVR